MGDVLKSYSREEVFAIAFKKFKENELRYLKGSFTKSTKKELLRKIYISWSQKNDFDKLDCLNHKMSSCETIQFGHYFHCKTCNQDDDTTICALCALRHQGHDIKYMGFSPFSCSENKKFVIRDQRMKSHIFKYKSMNYRKFKYLSMRHKIPHNQPYIPFDFRPTCVGFIPPEGISTDFKGIPLEAIDMKFKKENNKNNKKDKNKDKNKGKNKNHIKDEDKDNNNKDNNNDINKDIDNDNKNDNNKDNNNDNKNIDNDNKTIDNDNVKDNSKDNNNDNKQDIDNENEDHMKNDSIQIQKYFSPKFRKIGKPFGFPHRSIAYAPMEALFQETLMDNKDYKQQMPKDKQVNLPTHGGGFAIPSALEEQSSQVENILKNYEFNSKIIKKINSFNIYLQDKNSFETIKDAFDRNNIIYTEIAPNEDTDIVTVLQNSFSAYKYPGYTYRKNSDYRTYLLYENNEKEIEAKIKKRDIIEDILRIQNLLIQNQTNNQ